MSKAYLYRALRCRLWQWLHLRPGKCLLGSSVLHYRTISHWWQGHKVTRSLAVQFACCTRRTFTEDWRRNRQCIRFSCVRPVRANSCIESTTTNTTCQRLYHGIVCTLSAHQMSVNHEVSPAHTNVINWWSSTIPAAEVFLRIAGSIHHRRASA